MSLVWQYRCDSEEWNWKIHLSKLNHIFSNLHNCKYISPAMIPLEDNIRRKSLLRIHSTLSLQILTDPYSGPGTTAEPDRQAVRGLWQDRGCRCWGQASLGKCCMDAEVHTRSWPCRDLQDTSQECRVMWSKKSGLRMKEEEVSKSRSRGKKKSFVSPQPLASSCKLSKFPWSFLGLGVCKVSCSQTWMHFRMPWKLSKHWWLSWPAVKPWAWKC